MKPTITRDEFREAVELGIRSANTDAIVSRRLRKVADEAPQVAVGSFGEGVVCGCPLTKAGVTDRFGVRTDFGRRHMGDDSIFLFTRDFDNAVVKATGDHGDYEGYEVVEIV